MSSLSLRILEKKGLLVLFLTLLLTGCHLRPSGIPDKDEMKAVLRDLLLLESAARGNDSLQELRMQDLLERHGLTRAEYDSALLWYGRNARFLTPIYDELQAEFGTQMALLDSAYVDSTRLYGMHFAGTPSLWNGPSRLSIGAGRRLFVRTQPLSGLAPGDTAIFRVRILPPLSGEQTLSVEIWEKAPGGRIVRRLTRLIRPGERPATAFYLPEGSAAPSYEFALRFKNPHPDTLRLLPFGRITLDSLTLYKPVPKPVVTEAEESESSDADNSDPAAPPSAPPEPGTEPAPLSAR